jgi:hypothetical protein
VKNGQDRFGVPEENLVAATKWLGKKKTKKSAFYVFVPTRKDVATLPPDELTTVLVGWMCHSPIEIIPSRTQIAEVRTALLNRDDTDRLFDLIKMCTNYINYS